MTDLASVLALLVAAVAVLAVMLLTIHVIRVDGYGPRRGSRCLPGGQFWPPRR